MYLFEPGHSPYDLRWRMFGVDVRVHPLFWLLAVILGFNLVRDPQYGFALLLIWVVCVFFSILVHEFGHVLAFRVFGVDSHVVLFSFGGLAIPDRHIYSRWKRIIVSLAGPFAQLLIFAALLGLVALMVAQEFKPHLLVSEAIEFLLQINLFWALFNLIPVYPLDGGHVSRDFLDGVIPHGRGIRVSLIISLVVAAALAIHSLAPHLAGRFVPYLPSFGMLGAIMFGMLAVQSYQMLQEESNPPWRREG